METSGTFESKYIGERNEKQSTKRNYVLLRKINSYWRLFAENYAILRKTVLGERLTLLWVGRFCTFR